MGPLHNDDYYFLVLNLIYALDHIQHSLVIHDVLCLQAAGLKIDGS